MKKRLQFYLNYYETLTTKKSLTTAEAAREQEQLLIQIQFFQHERLIHLIVTALFALLTILSLFASLLLPKQPGTACTGCIIPCAFNSIHLSLLPLGKRRTEVVRILRQT